MNLRNDLNQETALSQEQQKELNIPIPITIEQGRTIHLAPIQGTGRLGTTLPSNLFEIPRIYLSKIARLNQTKIDRFDQTKERSSQIQAAIMQARRQLLDIATTNRDSLSNAEKIVLAEIEQSGGKKIKRNTRRKRRKTKRQNKKKNKSMKKYTKHRK